MQNNLFDTEKIYKHLNEIKNKPRFTPEKYEPHYTVTQFFDSIDGSGGIEVILYFVFRDGDISFYDSKEIKL